MTKSTHETGRFGDPGRSETAPAVQSQVELPFRIALGIVMQGLRIRLGRSLITIAGVVLGVAFIMANVTSQIARSAVRDEEAMRSAVRRMTSFLAAETGPVAGKTFGVVQGGPLSPSERRFVSELVRNGLARLDWWAPESLQSQEAFGPVVQIVPLDHVTQGAHAVLILGEGWLDDTAIWETLERSASGIPIASTIRGALNLPAASNLRIIPLEREPTLEQIQKAALEKRRGLFRSIWIIVISILVTVMSITNAILMSVTERFREIGTMKCLGAKSSFIRRLFLIESSIIGLTGGAVGALAGAVFSLSLNGLVYGFAMTVSLDFFRLFLAAAGVTLGGCVLSIVAALNPANVAASMTPSHALRSNV